MRIGIASLALVTACGAAQIRLPGPNRQPDLPAEIVWRDRIWERGQHSAFTDLVRFRDRWFLAFREASTHVSFDGAIRILSSADFERWQPAAHLTDSTGDLRDPKLCITPDGRLMLTAALMTPGDGGSHFQSQVWFSYDGREWTDPQNIGDQDVWIWRTQWHQGKAIAFGYSTSKQSKFLRAYLSTDGSRFQTLSPAVLDRDYPNETSVLFLPGDNALCLLRRDEGSKTALLGRSRPPFRAWTWTDLGVRIGGPHMIRLPDSRIVAAVRLYDNGTRTSLCWLDPEQNTLREFMALPSGGDTSYAGLAFHDGLLHVSYYSSHEGRTSIYLAKVKLPPRPKE